MKSIYRLGFKEPTPIQKACIPAAAHQGKVPKFLSSFFLNHNKFRCFGVYISYVNLEESSLITDSQKKIFFKEIE